VIKTKQQGDTSAIKHGARGVGAIEAVRGVIANDGVLGLWRGVSPSLVRVFFGVGLYFISLEQALTLAAGYAGEDAAHARRSHIAADGASKLTNSQYFGSGAVARVVAASAVLPLTVVKTRLEYGAGHALGKAGKKAAAAVAQADTAAAAAAAGVRRAPPPVAYTSIVHALRHIYATEGVRGLFSGWGVTVLRDAPYSGLYLLGYARLKQHIAASEWGGAVSPTLQHLIAGGTAALGATVVTHPFDVIRTRVQMVPTSTGSATHAFKLRNILSDEGALSLGRGFVPRIAKRATQTALVWTLYEEIVRRTRSA